MAMVSVTEWYSRCDNIGYSGDRAVLSVLDRVSRIWVTAVSNRQS